MPLTLEVTESIFKKVEQLCCYGSTNIGDALKSNSEFDKLLQKVTKIFFIPSEGVKEKVKKLMLEQPPEFAEILGIVGEARKVEKHINNNLVDYYYLPPKFYINSSVLHIVETIYPGLFKDAILENLRAVLASYTWEWELCERNFPPIEKNNLIHFLIKPTAPHFESEISVKDRGFYEQLVFKGIKAKTQDERRIFFEGLVSDVMAGALLYGYGNCALMADIAFLEAIYQQLPYAITYLRFTDTNIEELNAIAIGNWPKANCKIIIPWRRQNRILDWAGEIKKTSGISHRGVKVLCQLSENPNDIERKRCRAFLEKKGFENWLSYPQRIKKLQQIEENYETFIAALKEVGCITEIAPSKSPSP